MLAKREAEFEAQQRDYLRNAKEIDKAERKKRSIFNWAIIAATFIFVLFLAWVLLF